MRNRRIPLSQRVVLYGLLALNLLVKCSANLYSYQDSIGLQNPQQYFTAPTGLAVDSSGALYIVDPALHRLFKFSSTGSMQWQRDLAANGYDIKGPSAIATASGGNLILVNAAPPELIGLDASGRLLWRSEWPDSDQYDRPSDVAIDAQGTIYMSEAVGAQIHKFSLSGVWLSEFGVEGNDPGELSVPCGIAFDASGNLLVADNQLNRVQKFDTNGNYAQWTCGGKSLPNGEQPDPGMFYGLAATAVADDGSIFACDLEGGLISKFGSSGSYVSRLGGHGTADGQFILPVDIAFQSSTALWVADMHTGVLQKIATDSGSCLSKLGSAGTSAGQLKLPERLTVDAQGNIYVVDRGNNKVAKFDSDGGTVLEFGTGGSGDGEFSDPSGITLDETGQFLYVTDLGNCRVQKFTTSGVYQSQFGVSGDSDGEFQAPCGIAVDSTGRIYVTDTARGNVQRFGSTGIFQTTYDSGGLSSPESCLVVEPNGSAPQLYVTNSAVGRVQVYDTDTGGLISSFGGESSQEDGKFQYPIDVRTRPDGHVFVLEHFGDCRVQEFDASGVFVRSIRAINCGTDDLSHAGGLAFDGTGRLYIADAGGHRVARFAVHSGPALDKIGVDGVATSAAAVNWTTDIDSSSELDYWIAGGSTTHVGDTNPVKNHRIVLSALQPDSLYRFRVASSANNSSSQSGVLEFWTLPSGSTIQAENSVDAGYLGDWSKTEDANASSRVYAQSSDTTSPAKLYLNYTGTGVTIRYIGLPTGGKAKYYMDGSVEPSGEIDFYAATVTYDQSLSISGQTFGKHKLAIKWSGSSTGAGNTLALDSFLITR